MLDLKAKQISHRKGVNQALLATIKMRDVVDELNLIYLPESVVSDNSVPAHYAPTVRQGKLWFVTNLLAFLPIRELIQRGIEQIEHHSPTVDEVSSNTHEARQLVPNGDEMLKRAKRQCGQREPSLEVEVAHIRLYELNSGLNGHILFS